MANSIRQNARTVDTATFDAWRLTACLSVFLLSITSAVVVFNTENAEAMRRCTNSEATKQECYLVVYGR